ncbi:MAG: alpha/beta hydrolase [Bacteroidetes bacterium]|nr:alpha/beta hydrolase [Bacteroidota bacterium]
MKYFTLLFLPFLLTLFSLKDNNTAKSKTVADSNAPHELTDLKDIGFAWNLTDWQGNHVDSLTLDIYYPTGAMSNKKYPVVAFCHAGGFTGGDKTNVSSLCDILADYGYICVAFNYRTGYIKNNPHACTADTTTLWNAVYRGMQDGQACLRWIKKYGNKYKMDTSWIFYAGTSAGASVVLNSAYCNDSVAKKYFPREWNELGKINKSGNTFPDTYTLKGIGAMWGSLFSDQVINPSYRAYPTILFKGDEDSGLPDSVGYFYGCTNYAPPIFAGAGIYARMQAINCPSVFYELPGANHPAYDDEFCMSNLACFFNNIMQGTPYSGRFSYYTPSCPQFKGEF